MKVFPPERLLFPAPAVATAEGIWWLARDPTEMDYFRCRRSRKERRVWGQALGGSGDIPEDVPEFVWVRLDLEPEGHLGGEVVAYK